RAEPPRRDLPLPSKQLEDPPGLAFAPPPHGVVFAGLDRPGGEPLRRFADQGMSAVSLAGAFEPRGKVDGVTDHRVAAGLLGTDVADHHLACSDTDANGEFWKPATQAHQVRQLDLEG